MLKASQILFLLRTQATVLRHLRLCSWPLDVSNTCGEGSVMIQLLNLSIKLIWLFNIIMKKKLKNSLSYNLKINALRHTIVKNQCCFSHSPYLPPLSFPHLSFLNCFSFLFFSFLSQSIH